jgi:hypothetical protein
MPTVAEHKKASEYDARREPRTSLFVMATLYFDSGSAPVKVRDLAPRGALIEAGAIPNPGTRVRLCRGSFSVTGEVVWQKAQRGGLRFDSSVSVTDWLPGGAMAHQASVDRKVQQVKFSESTQSLAPSASRPLSYSKLSAKDLIELRVAIESLADDLAGDSDVVQRHSSKLQTLDLAVQLLKRLVAER